MAESTLTLTFDDIANEVAIMLGMARTRALRSDDEDADVDQCVHDGYMQFLTPPWEDAGLIPRKWTFLRLDTTLTMTADEETSDCPEDFACLLAHTLHYTDSDTGPFHGIKVRSGDEIRSYYQEDDDYSDDPAWCVVRPKAFTAATGQRYEVRWYPVTDTAHVVSFPYLAIPAEGSSTNYMQGGALHTQTLVASCRAVAERKFNDEVGKEWIHFLSCLRASHDLDSSNSPTNLGNYRDYGPPDRHGRRSGIVHGNADTTYS